jgi:hypothetical protein
MTARLSGHRARRYVRPTYDAIRRARQEVSNKGVRACLTRIARLTSTWTLTLTLTAVVEVDVAVDVEPIVDLHLDHRS